MKTVLAAFAVGLLFGLGLVVSGMSQPDKVLNFFDVAGHWDPSLALVMSGALAVTAPGFLLMRRCSTTLLGDVLQLPTRRDITPALLVGATCFGVGWGLVGYCPGPVITAAGFGNSEALTLVAAMVAGFVLARWLPLTRARSA